MPGFFDENTPLVVQCNSETRIVEVRKFEGQKQVILTPDPGKSGGGGGCAPRFSKNDPFWDKIECLVREFAVFFSFFRLFFIL